QAQDEVMPDATLWAAGARGAVLPQFLWQSREPLVKGCSDRNDCIVAPTNEVDQALIGGLLFVPRQVLDMAGTAQQDLHLVSRITAIDGVVVTLFDGLPASASRRAVGIVGSGSGSSDAPS